MLTVLLCPLLVFAEEKLLFASVFGENTIVEYNELSPGQRVLVVYEKMGHEGSKVVKKRKQTVKLDLQTGEEISGHHGFRCKKDNNVYVIGVLSKAVAKKAGFFHPLRGWVVDDHNSQLIALKDPKTVDCEWYQEGESDYPF